MMILLPLAMNTALQWCLQASVTLGTNLLIPGLAVHLKSWGGYRGQEG